jgi:hypothetical protein
MATRANLAENLCFRDLRKSRLGESEQPYFGATRRSFSTSLAICQARMHTAPRLKTSGCSTSALPHSGRTVVSENSAQPVTDEATIFRSDDGFRLTGCAPPTPQGLRRGGRCRARDRGVVGLGLGGRERGNPAEPYRRAFKIARDGGLGVVPHVGEAAGPESIREVLTMSPARIRHGIRAVEDPDLLAEIVERRIVLDVCPTSNLRLRGVPNLAAHPLPALRAAGVLCSISTDDPAMFGTDLGHEYAIAATLGVSAEDAYPVGT